MNRKQIALSVVLILLLALDAEAIYTFGYLGFFRNALANSAAVVSFVDTVVALGLVCIWMSADSRERGINALPYLLVAMALGSPGPLLYLIRRFADASEVATGFAEQPLRN